MVLRPMTRKEGDLQQRCGLRCDLGEGFPDGLQVGGAVYAVESILDVDKHHHLVRVTAVPVHPLPCSVHNGFCPVRNSDARPGRLEGVLDPVLHSFESNFPSEPVEGLPDRDWSLETERFSQRHERRPANPGTTEGGTCKRSCTPPGGGRRADPWWPSHVWGDAWNRRWDDVVEVGKRQRLGDGSAGARPRGRHWPGRVAPGSGQCTLEGGGSRSPGLADASRPAGAMAPTARSANRPASPGSGVRQQWLGGERGVCHHAKAPPECEIRHSKEVDTRSLTPGTSPRTSGDRRPEPPARSEGPLR